MSIDAPLSMKFCELREVAGLQLRVRSIPCRKLFGCGDGLIEISFSQVQGLANVPKRTEIVLLLPGITSTTLALCLVRRVYDF